MTDDAEIYRRTTGNRLMLADMLDGLGDTEWNAPTLCAGWTVTHLAAHLVQPMLIGFGRFFLAAIRYRGDTDRTVDHFTRRLARRPRAELIGLLREHAPDRVDPPRIGPIGPFADTAPTLVAPGRLEGLRLAATDTDWAGGSGALVTGPIEALALTATGRPAALTDLQGPGLDILAERLPDH